VIIRDFNFKGIVNTPYKTDSILIVDADAVLALPISVQLFQLVSGWTS